MNRLVVILLVLTWFHPIKAQFSFEEAERTRMAKAKVKVQTEWTHDYEDGKASEKGYKSAMTKYDLRGNAIEITNYNAEGKILSIVLYKYDSSGRKIGYERYQGDRVAQQYSQNTVYDAKGNKSKESGFDGASMYTNTFKYNPAGQLIEIVYMVDNAVVEKRTLKYSGTRTDISIFNPSNTLTYTQQNSYNAKGFLIEEKKTGGSGNIIHTVDFSYNDAGSMLEETRKREGDKLDYQKIYKYDNANRPVKEETVTLDGTSFVSHEYVYSNLGDLTLEKWKKTARAAEYSSKEYTYNSKGVYTDIICYFASYKLYTLYKYVYEFY